MAKPWGLKPRKYVAAYVFNDIALRLGPRSDGGDFRVADVLDRDVRTIKDWRDGIRPIPRSAYELLRLTLDERWRTYEHMTAKYRASKNQFLRGGNRLSASVGLHWGCAANDESEIVLMPSSDER